MDQVNMKGLLKKWDEILGEGTKIKSDKVRKSTALMLENQMNYLTEQNYSQYSLNRDGGYATSGDFHQIAIPMVRRTFPELIAHEIVGVQPMTGPVGLAFALRFRADGIYNGVTNQELGYNYMDTSYSGSAASACMETSAGEELGSDVQTGSDCCERGLGIGDGTMIAEVNMTVEKAQVEACTRKLRSRWSLEVAQDLKAMHNLDLESEMLDMLAYEITAEIDREIITHINGLATTSTWDFEDETAGTGFGRWETEKYRTLYNMIIRKANEIAVSTRRGSGNFVIASPTVCAALECLSNFVLHPVPNDINTAVTGVSKVGSLDGRLTLYRDTFASSDYVTIGYKGPSEYDTGVIYLPYVQLLVSRATFEDSFNPTVGLMSRYAIHDHIFGSERYYQRIAVSNMPD